MIFSWFKKLLNFDWLLWPLSDIEGKMDTAMLSPSTMNIASLSCSFKGRLDGCKI